jgi:hypothetical protein
VPNIDASSRTLFAKIPKCLYGVIEIADHMFRDFRKAAECASYRCKRIFDDLQHGENAFDFLFG